MPLTARIIIIASVTLLCAGAAYLMLARGSALLIDLSVTTARILLFLKFWRYAYRLDPTLFQRLQPSAKG